MVKTKAKPAPKGVTSKKGKKKPAKAKPKKVAPKKEAKPIGVISNFFEHISVAAIKLTAPLKVGDTIQIKGGEETDFTQKVSSMQVQHDKVTTAKKGDEIGIKVNHKARKGYHVYKA